MTLKTLFTSTTTRLRQLRWRLTVSYALVALATVLIVEWWGLVGAALFLSSELTPLDVLSLVVRIAVQVVLPTALALIIPTALVGALFGLITVHWLDHRLQTLHKITRAWQSGDFSERVKDATGDEISELAERLNHMADELQSLLAARQQLAALEERNHLARELHDSVKQASLAASLQLAAARARLTSAPGAAAENLKEAEDLVHQMQQELTGLIWDLRPVGLEGRGLKTALQAAAESWSRQTNILAKLTLSIQEPLNVEIEDIFYRILQEALANVARHSRAARVEINLSSTAGLATLVVRDDGIGFEPDGIDLTELGLRSMRERAKSAGGSLEIVSTPGQGTLVTARLPLPSSITKVST